MRFADWRVRIVALGLILGALSAGYVAYPYVTLYRLGQAMRRGDIATVTAAIDWNSVRGGIAEDVASTMMGAPAQPAADDLPAFGSSFASSVATTTVNEELTPKTFAASFVQDKEANRTSHGDARLTWAFFETPTRFVAAVRTCDGAIVRLRLDLIGVHWVLTRAWLPARMMARAG